MLNIRVTPDMTKSSRVCSQIKKQWPTSKPVVTRTPAKPENGLRTTSWHGLVKKLPLVIRIGLLGSSGRKSMESGLTESLRELIRQQNRQHATRRLCKVLK